MQRAGPFWFWHSRPSAEQDLGYKREVYERRGVFEYQIVDPRTETVDN